MISEEDREWARRELAERPPAPLSPQQIRALRLWGDVRKKDQPPPKRRRKAS